MLADFSRALRLVWIDYRATSPEGICRRDVMDTFGCSMSQAGDDLATYGKRNKKFFKYHLAQRRYRALGPIFTARQHQTVIEAVDLVGLINTKKGAKQDG